MRTHIIKTGETGKIPGLPRHFSIALIRAKESESYGNGVTRFVLNFEEQSCAKPQGFIVIFVSGAALPRTG
jgi:hypothetical protein